MGGVIEMITPPFFMSPIQEPLKNATRLPAGSLVAFRYLHRMDNRGSKGPRHRKMVVFISVVLLCPSMGGVGSRQEGYVFLKNMA